MPARLLQWFVVLAHKLKSPEPTPLLRLYCRGFRPADRAALGKLVLQAWIAQDTIAAWTPDEAAAKAEAVVLTTWSRKAGVTPRASSR